MRQVHRNHAMVVITHHSATMIEWVHYVPKNAIMDMDHLWHVKCPNAISRGLAPAAIYITPLRG